MQNWVEDLPPCSVLVDRNIEKMNSENYCKPNLSKKWFIHLLVRYAVCNVKYIKCKIYMDWRKLNTDKFAPAGVTLHNAVLYLLHFQMSKVSCFREWCVRLKFRWMLPPMENFGKRLMLLVETESYLVKNLISREDGNNVLIPLVTEG